MLTNYKLKLTIRILLFTYDSVNIGNLHFVLELVLETSKKTFYSKTVLALDVYSSAFFSISNLDEQADPIYQHQPKNRIT